MTKATEATAPAAQAAAATPAAPAKPAAKKAKKLVVAKGVSLTSKKGILGPGDEVKAEFFHGDGAAVIAEKTATGHIVEVDA